MLLVRLFRRSGLLREGRSTPKSFRRKRLNLLVLDTTTPVIVPESALASVWSPIGKFQMSPITMIQPAAKTSP